MGDVGVEANPELKQNKIRSLLGGVVAILRKLKNVGPALVVQVQLHAVVLLYPLPNLCFLICLVITCPYLFMYLVLLVLSP